MPKKPVLVEVDETLWKNAKTRASVFGITASAFVEQSLANYLVVTDAQAQDMLVRSASETQTYLSSNAPIAAATTSAFAGNHAVTSTQKRKR